MKRKGNPLIKYLKLAEKCLKQGHDKYAAAYIRVVLNILENNEEKNTCTCHCDTCDMAVICEYKGDYGRPVWWENT